MAKLGRGSKLTLEQWDEARRLFEEDGVGWEPLARRYNVTAPAIYQHAKRYGWIRKPEPSDREIDIAAEAEHDAVLVEHLKERLTPSPKPRQKTKRKRERKRKRTPSGRVWPSRPRPGPIPPAPAPRDEPTAEASGEQPVTADQADQPDGKIPINLQRKTGATAEILPFPGGHVPPKKDIPLLFPVRSKEEQAKLKGQLSALRGVLTVQQIAQLERTENLLTDYTHMLQVYLSPHTYAVREDDMDDAEYAERVKGVQRAAASLLFPTERDSLQGAILTLTRSQATLVQMKRLVAGIAKAGRLPTGSFADRDGDGDADPSEDRADLTGLGLEKLRTVRAAMQALTGYKDQANEPPKPPEPEPLDDLVVDRPEEPEVPR